MVAGRVGIEVVFELFKLTDWEGNPLSDREQAAVKRFRRDMAWNVLAMAISVTALCLAVLVMLGIAV